MLFANSPKLFAGSHVFLRLLPPRHPSYALILLDHIISNSLLTLCFYAVYLFFLLSLFKEHYYKLFAFKLGGANRTRTDRLLRAKQALYQMSYGPSLKTGGSGWT
jgi:hypothetical protein